MYIDSVANYVKYSYIYIDIFSFSCFSMFIIYVFVCIFFV